MMRPILILAVAEFQEGLRNRWVLSAALLLAALAFSLALLGSSPIGETRVSVLSVTTVSLASLSVYLIPLIALTLSYDAIVGEKERGTMLLLLTYPISRWQVICGKFIGHLAILAIAIALGYGSTGLYIAVTSGAEATDWWLFASMLASSLMLGSVFVALGYLISVTVSSRATAAGDSDHRVSAKLFSALQLLNPADVYRLFNLAGSEAAGLVSGTLGVLEGSFLNSGVLIAFLGLWIIAPLAASIWIFKRHEL
jgi:Cu-processing system permease protein